MVVFGFWPSINCSHSPANHPAAGRQVYCKFIVICECWVDTWTCALLLVHSWGAKSNGCCMRKIIITPHLNIEYYAQSASQPYGYCNELSTQVGAARGILSMMFLTIMTMAPSARQLLLLLLLLWHNVHFTSHALPQVCCLWMPICTKLAIKKPFVFYHSHLI